MPEAPRRAFTWPLAVLLGLLAVLAAGLHVFHSLRRWPGETLERGRETLRAARELVEAFRSQRVTTTFASEARALDGTTRLQVATLATQEVFTQKDEAALFWGQLELPDVLVEARAPVEYVYYLDLDGPWRFELREGTRLIRVQAPALAFNTPAVDVGALQYVVRQGSLLRDEPAALERLKRGLPALARERARRNLPLVRDTARRQAAGFVQRWLAQRFGAEASEYAVELVFADEAGATPQGPAPSVPSGAAH
jgi:hypothetical protein